MLRLQCGPLTPLQARLLASAAALATLALLFWSLSHPHFAAAAQRPARGGGDDHNWHRIAESAVNGSAVDVSAVSVPAVDVSAVRVPDGEHMHTRAEPDAQVQANDVASPFTATAGTTTLLLYPERLLTARRTAPGKGLPGALGAGTRGVKAKHPDLRRRRESDGGGRTVYISANTCTQPAWTGGGPQSLPPPQLSLHVATRSGPAPLGPAARNDSQDVYPFVGGFVNASVPGAHGDWYMAVSAPALPDGFAGSWTYRLAVSIDDYFHAADARDPFLYQVDTDIDSALLVTDNLTQADASDPVYSAWLDLGAPFVMFAVNSNLTGLRGLESSFCGLHTFASDNHQVQARQDDMDGTHTNIQMGMVTRGLGRKPKQQFYVNGLNASSDYRAFLAMDGNSSASGDGVVGGGGKVWAPVPFRTKSDGNCQLLFNLTFCDEVAYAVPANPLNAPVAAFHDLQRFYENYTQTWYAPFNATLAQIACHTTADAQYSLAKTCAHCADAYKQWLCAVSIPRCEDFSSPAAHLQPRNVAQKFYNNDSRLDPQLLLAPYAPMPDAPTLPGSTAFRQTYLSSFATNRSRNPAIDHVVAPGPYKELLPCEDLCYSLIQSCPASMQFACPAPGRGLEVSYGRRSPSGLTCSYLGAVYYLNAAPRARAESVAFTALAVAAAAAWWALAST